MNISDFLSVHLLFVYTFIVRHEKYEMVRMTLKNTFSLLNADHVKLDKNWNYKHIISPFYRLYLIDGGQGSLFNSGESHVLESGFLYLIPSFTICDYQCSDFLSQYYIHFMEESADGNSLFSSNRKIMKFPATQIDFDNFRRILHLNPGRGLIKSADPKEYEKRRIIQEFQEMNKFLDPSAFMETHGIILQFLSRFLSKEHFQRTDKKEIPSKILDAINHIQTHLEYPLTVELLADRANQNPDYFSRIFKENTGERPVNYIQFKRIERAQLLIITTDLPFHEISIKTGFESLAYFSRTFKNITGLTPSQYKQKNKAVEP